MYDYNACTDEELILRLRDGEEAIMDYILNKYKNLVRKYARNMYILGAEEQDLIQEGMIDTQELAVAGCSTQQTDRL